MAVALKKMRLEDIAKLAGTSKTKPAEGLFIEGKVSSARTPNIQIVYGIESYFVPEGEGLKIERSRNDMYAKVTIDSSGRSVVKSLVTK